MCRLWMKRSNRVSIHLSRFPTAWKFVRRANLATPLCQSRWQSPFYVSPRIQPLSKKKKKKKIKAVATSASVSPSLYSTATRFLSLLHSEFFFVLYRSVWKFRARNGANRLKLRRSLESFLTAWQSSRVVSVISTILNFFFFSSTRIFQFNPFVYEIPRFMMLKRSIFFFCWDKEISCFVWSKRDIQYSKLLINLKLNLFIVIFVGNACRKDIVARILVIFQVEYLQKRTSFDETVCCL